MGGSSYGDHCVQAVGKKLAVVEVCVGRGVARVRGGRRGEGGQEGAGGRREGQTRAGYSHQQERYGNSPPLPPPLP